MLYHSYNTYSFKMTTSSSVPHDTFRRVLEDFKATLRKEEVDEFELCTLVDLKDAILAIQAKQASEKKLRNLTRLRSFLEAMEQYEQIIKVFLNTTNLLAFIWVRGSRNIPPRLCVSNH